MGSGDSGLIGLLPSPLSDGPWELPLASLPPLASITSCFTVAQPRWPSPALRSPLSVSEEEREEAASQAPSPPPVPWAMQ